MKIYIDEKFIRQRLQRPPERRLSRLERLFGILLIIIFIPLWLKGKSVPKRDTRAFRKKDSEQDPKVKNTSGFFYFRVQQESKVLIKREVMGKQVKQMGF